MEKSGIRHLRSIAFWRLFLSCALLTFAITFGMFFYAQENSLNESKQRTEEQSERTIALIRSDLDSILSDEVYATLQMNSLSWVPKLYADYGAFDSAMTVRERLQLSENHLLYAGATQIEKRIFLIFPYRNLCVSHKVWVNIDDYLGMLKIPIGERADFLAEIQRVVGLTRLEGPPASALEGTITLCIPMENTHAPRAYAIFIFSRVNLEKQIRTQLTGALCGLEIQDAATGETLLSVASESVSGRAETRTVSSAYIDWDYVFTLDPGVFRVVYTASQQNALLVSVLLFFGSILFSYLLAYVSYRPLGRLTSKIGGKKSEGRMLKDCQMIGQSLDALRLRQEEDRRYNALRLLLSGYFNEDSSELGQCGLRFHNRQWYQVYLITDLDKSETQHQATALTHELQALLEDFPQLIFEGIELESNAYALLVAYPHEDAALRLDHEIQQRIAECGGSIFVGQISAGLIGASIAYQSARDKYTHSAGNIRYYFPLEWENQFITALRAGNSESVDTICAQLRKENERRRVNGEMDRGDMLQLLSTLINDVQRVATETDMLSLLPENLNVFAGRRMAEIWDEIPRMCAALCERLRTLTRIEDDTVLRILRFTEENFTRHDLCLKTMESEFSVSSSTLTKCFKAGANSTFYAYLTRLRMEYACALIKKGGRSIAEVADLSGYDNEYSFRRVFQRTIGVKAQDYAATQAQTIVAKAKEEE